MTVVSAGSIRGRRPEPRRTAASLTAFTLRPKIPAGDFAPLPSPHRARRGESCPAVEAEGGSSVQTDGNSCDRSIHQALPKYRPGIAGRSPRNCRTRKATLDPSHRHGDCFDHLKPGPPPRTPPHCRQFDPVFLAPKSPPGTSPGWEVSPCPPFGGPPSDPQKNK